jgi:spore coat polysaccharide biosynthesis predicted glycosyltransferase SpsG
MGLIKLDKKDVELIRDLCDNTILFDKEIAQMFGVSRKHINAIRNKKRWNYEYGADTDDANRRAIERAVILHR